MFIGERCSSSASARPRRIQRQLGGAGVCAVCSIRTRAPDRPLFDDASKRVAVVLVPSSHDASCRASVAAASAFGTITPVAGVASEPPGDDHGRRSLWKARLYTRGFGVAKRRFRGNGAWERVVSHIFAPTDQFGVQIDLTPGSQSKCEMPYFPPS